MGALRIVHEKFRAKRALEEYEQFKSTFNNAIAAAPDMKPHIGKAHEDMNPLRVLNLFKAISDEVWIMALYTDLHLVKTTLGRSGAVDLTLYIMYCYLGLRTFGYEPGCRTA